ncbi:MAG TPA: hypothetical protein VH414_02875 [Lichenihabitans sp.]|nr:hypothetical protein [Lichenihabitans sp.]
MLRKLLRAATGLGVSLANDGQCAVTAEWRFGEIARQLTNFVYVYLGMGLGSIGPLRPSQPPKPSPSRLPSFRSARALRERARRLRRSVVLRVTPVTASPRDGHVRAEPSRNAPRDRSASPTANSSPGELVAQLDL